MWLQKEVADGKLVVEKVDGTDNPADLMTKVLSISDIRYRLALMNMYVHRSAEGVVEVGRVWGGYEKRRWQA